MTIKESRVFDLMELRRIISKQDFFNNVNEHERYKYIENTLKFAANADATKENIYKIAENICENSLHDDFYQKEDIADLMKYIFDSCVYVYYEIVKTGKGRGKK